MSFKTPLIWDEIRNVPRRLEPAEGLEFGGGLSTDGPVGFWGEGPVVTRPDINGHWGTSLIQALDALIGYGLLGDERAQDWGVGLDQVIGLGELGAYETGRLIIGSTAGWMNLDQPAREVGVIQVPTAYSGQAETLPDGGLRRQLAYSPVLSYGVEPPAAIPMTGALWFDSAGGRLKVWNGLAWEGINPSGLDSLQTELEQADYGRLFISDGDGGVVTLEPVPGDVAGLLPMADAAGAMQLVRLLSVQTTPPWENGTSAYGTPPGGGGRGSGLHHAIWFSPAANAERLSLWDEATQQWKGVPLNNPLVQGLADLRTTITSGDLLAYLGSQLVRLPIGSSGDSLTVVNNAPAWHSRFQASPTAPADAVAGDLWLDGSDGLWLRTDTGWRDLQQTHRYKAVNGTGGSVQPGTAMVHDGSQWRLAGPATSRDALVGVALGSALAGAPVSVGVGGVVELSAAAWSGVIDEAEPHPAFAGLIAGRHYFVSETTAGKLTTVPALGRELSVGLALSATHLLLRPAPALSHRAGHADVQSLQPSTPAPGALWWDRSSSTLLVYVPGEGGAAGSWEPVADVGDDGTGQIPTPEPPAIVDLEVVAWATDPAAAAIRFTFGDGSFQSVRLRGAGGATVTMSDNRTLVFDGGGSSSGVMREVDGGRFSL